MDIWTWKDSFDKVTSRLPEEPDSKRPPAWLYIKSAGRWRRAGRATTYGRHVGYVHLYAKNLIGGYRRSALSFAGDTNRLCSEEVMSSLTGNVEKDVAIVMGDVQIEFSGHFRLLNPLWTSRSGLEMTEVILETDKPGIVKVADLPGPDQEDWPEDEYA